MVRCGGEISAYTTQTKSHKWEMLGTLPHTRRSRETLWYAVGRN
jgi:hypothetical protein